MQRRRAHHRMTDMHARGFCPRCLLSEVPGAEALNALMRQWIDAIDPQRRSGDALLEERLSACRACRHLSAGLCGLCGCYVEYRAAQAAQRCPDVPSRW